MNTVADQLDALKKHFPDTPHFHLGIDDELISLNIHHPTTNAKLLLQGAQLVSCCPVGEQPLLWQSHLSEYKTGRPIRGGIPICWPWFGDLSANPDIVQNQIEVDAPPAHGFARNQEWLLLSVDSSDAGVSIHLRLETEVSGPLFWRFPCVLNVKIHIGRTLNVDLSVSNLGDQSIAYSAALHSYFPVSSIEHIDVIGFDGLSYVDALDQWQPKTQVEPLIIRGEVDRIYQQTPKQFEIVDRQWRRRLIVRSEGSQSTVLWNPGVEKSKRLSTFANDEYQDMLCIETANTLTDCITVAPNETASLKLSVSSQAL